MQGARHTTMPAVAAFFMALMVSCFASPYEECLEHQLVPDAAINNAVLALTKGEHSTDGSVFEKWSSGPLVVNVTSWHSNIENTLQPFTRSCEGGDATVDAEFEVSWVVSAQFAVGEEEDVLGAVDVVFRQAVAKVRFQLSMFSANETFTLHPLAARATWPGTVSASVYSVAHGYYGGPVDILASLLAKFYAFEILSWNSARSVITRLFVDRANEMGPFYVEF
ncbi:uncharacterized protein LOC125946549 [Dermacentor silvarum]|uniref:uncharacterized protein LOC125946549 n=1 Tax=Dermacentor silvarum TaxID=543639 RepID=UPI00210196AD|nr:uncharacterized protein LOC125946549 [Dermacentor silvarum]